MTITEALKELSDFPFTYLFMGGKEHLRLAGREEKNIFMFIDEFGDLFEICAGDKVLPQVRFVATLDDLLAEDWKVVKEEEI